jgi:uncharacterized protein (TIGR03382 family)
MKKAILACAVLSLPFAARAQSFTLTSPEAITFGTSTTPQIYIGAADCAANEVLNFHWDFTAIGGVGAGQEVFVVKSHSASACNTTTAPTGVGESQSQTSTNITGDDSSTASAMILDPDGGLPGGCTNTTVSSASPYSTFYCIQLQSTGISTGLTAQQIQINYATQPPTPPTQIVVQPGDTHFKVYWQPGNASENISTYDVHVALGDAGITDTSVGHAAETSSLNADVTTTDDGKALVNGNTYTVQILANDVYGNISALSDNAQATPVNILDFYQLYRQDGGSATGGGGCSSAGAATWIAVLALAVGIAARRRKRARNGAALVVFFALLAPRAQAQQADRPLRYLLVGLKIDRYDPKVDSEAGLTGDPYKAVFGTRAPLRWQLEVDWEAWHPYGTFMIGATLGYWQNFGHGLVKATGLPSEDTALLDVMPFGIVATYRFDKIADWWPRWPVIPYAQAGLMRALWASFNGTGDVSTSPGARGSGWTWGYTTALGFAVPLDAFDPDLSREAYSDTGVQRSSVFAEYGWTHLDNFGGTGVLILSDRAWRFGVSIEF